MTVTVCWVCGLFLETEEAHTFHAEGCPKRLDPDLGPADAECQFSDCGEDVHPRCCPTCVQEVEARCQVTRWDGTADVPCGRLAAEFLIDDSTGDGMWVCAAHLPETSLGPESWGPGPRG